MYIKQLVLLTTLLFSLFFSFSQTKAIDSLTLQLAFQKQDSLKVNTSIILIDKLIINEDYEKASQYIDQSETLATQLNYTKGIADLFYYKAQVLIENNDIKNAVFKYNQSLNYYAQLKDSLGLAKVNNSIGQLYIKNKGYTKGIKYILSAIKIFEEKDLKHELSKSYSTLGEGYFQSNKIDKALKFNQKALDTRKDLNDVKGIIESTYTLACLYSINKEHRKAIDYYENALTFLNLEENKNLKGNILPNIGREYLKFNEYQKAFDYLSEALEFNTSIDNKKGLIKSWIYLSEYNLKISKFKLADYQINKAYALSQDIEEDQLKLETLKILIAVDSTKSDYRRAFKEQKEFYLLKQKIESAKLNNTTLSFEDEINVVVPEIKIPVNNQVQTDKIEKLNLDIKKLNLVIYSLIALVAILLISIYFLSKNNKKQLKFISKHNNIENTIEIENKELKTKLQNLEEMNQVKNRLFSIVSHDLKDSITSIKSFIDLLKDKGISQVEFNQLLPELSESADNASSLLLNLLSWSKSQMQNLEPKAELFDIKDVFDEKLHLIKKKVAKKKIVVIDESISEGVYADRNMIEIVIQNLLANAVKFSRVGDVITVSNRQKNGNTLICIADTGVGISEENQKKLFNNEGYTTRGTDKEKGTGLGLSICKQLLDLNNGKIWVESEPNLGSKFYIELPKERT